MSQTQSERFPFSSFPIGWFALGWSADLAPGAVVPVKAFGRELVLFRTDAGHARVLDAFCPHLGTHLGYGGRVVSETIQCPFHAWRFDGAGMCVEIPNAKKIPPKAELAAWTVRETNGVVLVHHDPEGRVPSYEVPHAPELAGGDWTEPQRYGWKLRTHVQEICENLADVNHFGHLHGLVDTRQLECELGDTHYRMKLEAQGTVVDMRLYGLGAELSRVELGGEHFFVTKLMTPIDADHIELRIASSAKIHGDPEDAERRSALFREVTSLALLQDAPLWEHKVYRATPLLSSEDGPIAPFRRWARRFYPQSPQARETHDERAARDVAVD